MSQAQESNPVTAEAVTSKKEGIQPGLADRAEAIKAIAQARENLGHIATDHEVHTDASGVVMTDHEVQSELAYRAANGRPSDDSHTEV